MSTIKKITLACTALFAVMGSPLAANAAEDYAAAIKRDVVPQVKSWLADSGLIAAVNSQNSRHASLGQSDIDRLDSQWRSETSSGNRKLVDAVLSNSLSGYLNDMKSQGSGLYTEIFVMDNKGLNVGQSDVTSDYWQGDEAKWQKTYLAGPSAVFVDDVEFDESSQTFQSQLSLPVVDPDSGEVIGAVTVGVNVEMLQ
ncbi:MAG: cache domain-containing protein [Alphaproteobacteria bacterium]|nr:cache domain-containing protein [Alphaproteobacteria bacterium]